MQQSYTNSAEHIRNCAIRERIAANAIENAGFVIENAAIVYESRRTYLKLHLTVVPRALSSLKNIKYF